MKKLVSIIIPCYNQGLYLGECIDSIDKQTYKNIEVIIVNDGSTDEITINFLNELEKFRKDIKIINQSNNGVCNARNNGILNCRGHYILPLDGDDKIAATYIEKCVQILDDNSQLNIVYCIGKCFGYKNGIFVLDDFSVSKMLKQNLVFCSAMFRKSDFDRTKGYNSNMIYGYEDWDFWLSMIENENEFFRINEILFFYRIKSFSRNVQTSTGNLEQRLKMIKQIVQNHENLYAKYKVKASDIEPVYKSKFELYFMKFYLKIKYALQKIKLLYLAK